MREVYFTIGGVDARAADDEPNPGMTMLPIRGWTDAPVGAPYLTGEHTLLVDDDDNLDRLIAEWQGVVAESPSPIGLDFPAAVVGTAPPVRQPGDPEVVAWLLVEWAASDPDTPPTTLTLAHRVPEDQWKVNTAPVVYEEVVPPTTDFLVSADFIVSAVDRTEATRILYTEAVSKGWLGTVEVSGVAPIIANAFCSNRSTAGDACGACPGCTAEVARLNHA